MIYGSVCSGIEAATVAWHPLGWKASFFSEIEKAPRDVLTHHYPNTSLHGDFTTIQKGDYEPIELLVGGTPCQSFSVAGLREGLNDPRGNLMLEFGALAQRLQPKWLVWENVPGVLSSNGGKDFGSFLAMLGELGYGFAYRVLDAQYFGVPQRRRRVFVIGYFGDWRCAAAVLFERDSLQGNPPPSRGEGQEVTGTLTRGFGDRGLDLDQIAGGGYAIGSSTVSKTLMAGGNKQDPEIESYAIYSLAGNTIGRQPENGGNGDGWGEDVSYTLTKTDQHAVAYAFDSLASNSMKSKNPNSGCNEVDVSKTIDTSGLNPTCNQGGNAILQSVATHEVAGTMMSNSKSGGFSNSIDHASSGYMAMQNMQVRRLLPIECERLQGFPEIVKKVRITVCTDPQNNYANAETKNHKLPKRAGNAGKTASKENASFATLNLNANNLKHSKPAELSAHIDLEQLTLQIHNQEKLVLSVNLAEMKKSFRQFTQVENIARLLVLVLKELEPKASNGRVELQPNIKHSFPHRNGNAYVDLFGQEIEELANDAVEFTTKASEYLKSITLEAGQDSQVYEQHLKTLCCFVTAAISTFIQEAIPPKSSYKLNLKVSHGYTNVAGLSDSARYKALGNSMAVPVMAWLGKRIDMVEKLCAATA